MAKKKAPAKRRPADPNRLAQMLGSQSTEDENITIPPSKDEISRVMAALGRKGGKAGGAARANALSKDRRSEIAKAAAKKRWGAKGMSDKDKAVAALIATKII
jgi:hypothetical protein